MATLVDYANLSAAQIRWLASEVHGLHTLEQVVRWGLSQTPEYPIRAVIVQDEYCYDVVLHWDSNLHLVFDTS